VQGEDEGEYKLGGGAPSTWSCCRACPCQGGGGRLPGKLSPASTKWDGLQGWQLAHCELGTRVCGCRAPCPPPPLTQRVAGARSTRSCWPHHPTRAGPSPAPATRAATRGAPVGAAAAIGRESLQACSCGRFTAASAAHSPGMPAPSGYTGHGGCGWGLCLEGCCHPRLQLGVGRAWSCRAAAARALVVPPAEVRRPGRVMKGLPRALCAACLHACVCLHACARRCMPVDACMAAWEHPSSMRNTSRLHERFHASKERVHHTPERQARCCCCCCCWPLRRQRCLRRPSSAAGAALGVGDAYSCSTRLPLLSLLLVVVLTAARAWRGSGVSKGCEHVRDERMDEMDEVPAGIKALFVM